MTRRSGADRGDRAGSSDSPDPWASDLLAAVAARGGDAAIATELARLAPASYRERTRPDDAALDVDELAELAKQGADTTGQGAAATDVVAAGPVAAAGATSPTANYRFVVRPADGTRFHIRRFANSPVVLTTMLPVLESFGLVVEESVPHRLEELGEGARIQAFIDDAGVRLAQMSTATGPGFDPVADGPRLVDALEAASSGRNDVDRLNGLVTSAGLTWREVSLLRTYVRYWVQCSAPVPAGDLEAALLTYPAAARALVTYFLTRFDPAPGFDPAPAPGFDPAPAPDPAPARTEPDRHLAADAARTACLDELGRVPHLRSDRALRIVLALIDATLRTSYFQLDGSGSLKSTLVVKLDSSAVPHLPKPVPFVETWVHSPEVEAVHLRAGLVARGGIRWSERPEDFRTEVLDLMAAQDKKNAVIIPAGAKGGFVCRHPTAVTGSVGPGTAVPESARWAPPQLDDLPSPGPEHVRREYAAFIDSILDVTDNLVGGEVVTPPGVVAYDGPDPYLVVAADKGTADFSDLANEISIRRGFWLGDAFASGGSHGYNHKAMGITARGTWVAVRRHFHQLGIDVQREPIRVVGVGDMSGDVFGNGMLSSRAIRLVAAFDHRHVFLDPDPDPASSFAERQRLAGLPRSTWDDYRRELLSEGGGIWPRDAKTIPLAEPARRALGIEAERLTPPELISAILEAPVDLLFFGGIGTFIKAAGETDLEVADHANDEVRVTANRVRARVIAEGGNLGITQKARIRYSRRGGRINTDFLDNVAGVATSDLEVNLKILLALAIEQEKLAPGDRDGYLLTAEPEVASGVLHQVDRSVSALNRSVPDSAAHLDAYTALIDVLESSGRVQRGPDELPEAEEIGIRREAGAGLIRPELAVLLAHTKSHLVAAIEATPGGPASAYPIEPVAAYFPRALRDGFAELIPQHRLYPQILATQVAGEIVDRLGMVWADETSAELGRDLDRIAAGYWTARDVTGAPAVWAELDERWTTMPAEAENHVLTLVGGAVAGLARDYVRRDLPPGGALLSDGTLVARDADVAEALATTPLPDGALKELLGVGVPADVAERALAVRARAQVGDVGPVVRATGRDAAEVARTLELLDATAGLARMAAALKRTDTGGRWRSWLARGLLDDLSDWRREVATELLRQRGDAAVLVAQWDADHSAELESALRLLDALDADDNDPATVVAVALRRLPRPAAAT